MSHEVRQKVKFRRGKLNLLTNFGKQAPIRNKTEHTDVNCLFQGGRGSLSANRRPDSGS